MTNRIPSYLEYIKTIAITGAGSGYTSPVTLIIDAPTGDNPIQATATATIDFAGSGDITSITISEAGDGYDTAPSVKITGAATTVSSTTTNTGLDAGTYNNVVPTSTSGIGEFATFNIVIDANGDVTSIVPSTGGQKFVQNDTVTFLATALGGVGTESDVVGTITHINGAVSYTHLRAHET